MNNKLLQYSTRNKRESVPCLLLIGIRNVTFVFPKFPVYQIQCSLSVSSAAVPLPHLFYTTQSSSIQPERRQPLQGSFKIRQLHSSHIRPVHGEANRRQRHSVGSILFLQLQSEIESHQYDSFAINQESPNYQNDHNTQEWRRYLYKI